VRRAGRAITAICAALWLAASAPAGAAPSASRAQQDTADATALAANLKAQGKLREAERLLRQALKARRKALGEQHADTGVSYAALADTLAARGKTAEAERLHRRALEILLEARGPDDPATAAAYAGLAGDLTARGRYAEAETLSSRAVAIARARRAGAGADAVPAEGPVFRRYPTVAWLAAREAPGDLPRLRDAAFTAAQDLDVSPAARAIVQTAAHGPGPLSALSIAQAQRRLRPREGLLLIVPTGEDVHVFAVSRSRTAWNRIAGGQADLERRIRALRCQVDELACAGRGPAVARGGQAVFDGQTAHGLYLELVAPVESALAGVDRLYVTTSGTLGGLPLALLPVAPPDGALPPGLQSLAGMSWLADRYALTTLPAIASLRAAAPSRRPASQRWTFVGYGDPTLGGARPTLRPLPGAATELRAMAQALGAPTTSLHLGVRATEAALKTSPDAPRAGVLAIATHGLLSHELDGVDEPGLVLTPPATATAEDDGVLTATEAAALDLSAEWVILSACNTAGTDGTPGADSLSGLARAFLYAGARALLVSHWRVYDDATAALTVQTLAIQRANPRLSKAQALQKAMRAVRTGRRPDGSALPGWRPDWAHPAYWAPFVLIAAEG